MQARPWDFMTKDTPSRDWSEGSGVMITIAFFFGGIAGGLYLYSLYTNNLWGMFIGWICAAIMGLVDMSHLPNKKIFWRMMARPHSSWISRGFLFVFLFLGSAAIQMAITYWAPGNAFEIVFKVIAGIFALGVASYSGFVVSYVSSVKLWHSAVMPVLFIVAGLTGGAAITLLINGITGTGDFQAIKMFQLVMLGIYTVIVAMHLWISTYSNSNGRTSVMAIVKGDLAKMFWIVIVFIGIAAPFALVSFMSENILALTIINTACVLAGNMSLRYAIMRAGHYSSLLPD